MTGTQTRAEASGLQVTFADSIETLTDDLAAWDGLAVRASAPFCAPGWMLAWWRSHRRPDDRLRVMLVHDHDGALVAVAPFFMRRRGLGSVEYQLLSTEFAHRIGVLCDPGSEHAVARALAEALATGTPTPTVLTFAGVDLTTPWPRLIAERWPGPGTATVRVHRRVGAPLVDLRDGWAAWLARRERTFRKQARRKARRLEEQGVTMRLAHDRAAVEAFLDLHHARWQGRQSNLGAAARATLLDAAETLGPRGRLGIVLLEHPDGAIAAELIVSAGTTVALWNGGFDPAWSKHSPGVQALLRALELAADHGWTVADFGAGPQEYKRRLADSDEPVGWITVLPPTPHRWLERIRHAPRTLAATLRPLAARLPPRQRQWVERVAAAVRRLPRR